MTPNILKIVCLIAGLYFAWKGGSILLKTNPLLAPTISKLIPMATLLLTLAIALPTTLQFFFPEILVTLRRDYTRFANGEWWRLVTPLFVQDAGVAGAAFNLVSLVLVGGVAERLWGRSRMLAIFFIGAAAGEVVAFSWQPYGAGNSVGNFSLAASIAVACLSRQPNRTVQIAALLALGADVLLVILKDIHGAAAMAGVLLAIALRRDRFATDGRDA